MLWACDAAWWKNYGPAVDFAGLRLTNGSNVGFGTKRLEIDLTRTDFVLDQPGVLGNGTNGGFHAINLAAQFGAPRIALVGFDFRGEHWHGRHPRGMNNPSDKLFQNWRAGLAAAAPALKERGIDVFNCSSGSTIQCFPFARLPDLLERGSGGVDREAELGAGRDPGDQGAEESECRAG